MKHLDLPEIEILKSWLGSPKKSPRQINKLNTSDSEIVRLSKGIYLCSTIDTIDEEIHFNLYNDPFTIGWISVIMSYSDLCATNATPLGFLLSSSFSKDWAQEKKKRMSLGIQAALRKINSFLLGGDSGESLATTITSTGLGIAKAPKQRTPISAGDYVVVFDKLALNQAFGFEFVLKTKSILEKDLWKVPLHISDPLIKASMDCSDGIWNTLLSLAHLNKLSFNLFYSKNLFHPKAINVCETHNLPIASLLFGELGDYSLFYVIPKRKIFTFKKKFPNSKVLAQFTNVNDDLKIHTSTDNTIQIKQEFIIPKRFVEEIKIKCQYDLFKVFYEIIDEVKRFGLL